MAAKGVLPLKPRTYDDIELSAEKDSKEAKLAHLVASQVSPLAGSHDLRVRPGHLGFALRVLRLVPARRASLAVN
jgi:hypothetical protein